MKHEEAPFFFCEYKLYIWNMCLWIKYCYQWRHEGNFSSSGARGIQMWVEGQIGC